MEKDFIYSVLEFFIVDAVLESHPSLKLNTEFLETIKSDCELIAAHYEEFDLDSFSTDITNDDRDGVLSFYFNNFILTPDSVLLSAFAHASKVDFRAENGLIVMTLTYHNLFLE